MLRAAGIPTRRPGNARAASRPALQQRLDGVDAVPRAWAYVLPRVASASPEPLSTEQQVALALAALGWRPAAGHSKSPDPEVLTVWHGGLARFMRALLGWTYREIGDRLALLEGRSREYSERQIRYAITRADEFDSWLEHFVGTPWPPPPTLKDDSVVGQIATARATFIRANSRTAAAGARAFQYLLERGLAPLEAAAQVRAVVNGELRATAITGLEWSGLRNRLDRLARRRDDRRRQLRECEERLLGEPLTAATPMRPSAIDHDLLGPEILAELAAFERAHASDEVAELRKLIVAQQHDDRRAVVGYLPRLDDDRTTYRDRAA
jgi:hypothetical protein